MTGAPKRGAANEQGFHDIAKLLNESLSSLLERQLPSAVILQIFGQAFYSMNVIVFNALLDYSVLDTMFSLINANISILVVIYL